MELLFDAAIAMGLLALLVVVIYLADKVRSLENRAAPAPAPASPPCTRCSIRWKAYRAKPCGST